jgi:hypothetical protein
MNDSLCHTGKEANEYMKSRLCSCESNTHREEAGESPESHAAEDNDSEPRIGAKERGCAYCHCEADNQAGDHTESSPAKADYALFGARRVSFCFPVHDRPLTFDVRRIQWLAAQGKE